MKTFFEYLDNGNMVVVLRESMEIYDGLLKMIDENEYSDDSFLIFADWLESVGRRLDSMFVRLVIDNNEVKHYVGSARWHLGLARIRRELDNPSIENYDKSNINHNFFNVARNHRFDFQAIPFYDLIDILAHAGVGMRHSISFDAAKFLVTWRVMDESQIITLMRGMKDLRERGQLLPLIFEEYPHLSNHVRNGLHHLVRNRI
jgi:uncharacterized protein (TIGR02996 family)